MFNNKKTGTTAMDELNKKGAFVRSASKYRSWIKKDGSTKYLPEKDRYLLYVSYACPWASRCLFVIEYLGLEEYFEICVVNARFTRTRPDNDDDKHVGWSFNHKDNDQDIDTKPDPILGAKYLRDIYEKFGNPEQQTKFTVPLLFDKKTKTIVSNESADIIRMLSQEFDEVAKNPKVLYPKDLSKQIDEINEWIYDGINDGVYKSGFSTTQEAYDEASALVYKSLDRVEDVLSKSRYLVSNSIITEADIRLFVTIIRFDCVYNQHFKLNKKLISAHYPNLFNYTKELYQLDDVKKSVNFWHITNHYYRSHKSINRFHIVAHGPDINWDESHDRNKFSKM